MAAKRNTRLDGMLEATKIVAEVVGDMKLGDMHQQTWETICNIQSRLLHACAAEAQEEESRLANR